MENGPLPADFPMEAFIYKEFSVAMSVIIRWYQPVSHDSHGSMGISRSNNVGTVLYIGPYFLWRFPYIGLRHRPSKYAL